MECNNTIDGSIHNNCLVTTSVTKVNLPVTAIDRNSCACYIIVFTMFYLMYNTQTYILRNVYTHKVLHIFASIAKNTMIAM